MENRNNRKKAVGIGLCAAVLLFAVLFTAITLIGKNSHVRTDSKPPVGSLTDSEIDSDSVGKDQEDIVDSNTENAEENADIAETEPLPYIDPLTGLPCAQDYSTRRPLAVMINNIRQAIPQRGISEADILYECLVEGGITRLMAIFPDYTALPTLGSIRSSRDYYVDLAQAHDALYAHCGGSDDAYTTLSARHIDNIDGVNGSSAAASAYVKDPERVKNMGYEHASMTDGAKMAQAIDALSYRTELSDGFTQPLRFSENDRALAGSVALSLNVKFSAYAQSFFSYDANRTNYLKGQYGDKHIDANNGYTLSFKNILLLSANYSDIAGDEKHRLNLDFTGSGKGYIFCNGTMTEIVWKKPDRQTQYELFEADGQTPLTLNPGKTYIGIVNGLSAVTVSDTLDERLISD